MNVEDIDDELQMTWPRFIAIVVVVLLLVFGAGFLCGKSFASDYVKAPDGSYVSSSDGTVSQAPDGSWHGGDNLSFTRTPDGAWHGSED